LPRRIFLGLALAAAALAGCEKKPDRLTLEPVGIDELRGWSDDRLVEALPAIRSSCAKLAAEPDDMPAGPAGTALRAADWRPACAAFATLRDDDVPALRGAIEQWLKPFRAGNNGSADGLFTGYYEPELHGSRHSGGRFTIPLYGRPVDLVTVDLGDFDESFKGKRIAGRVSGGALKPYATRAEIEAGAVAGKASELLWVDDPIDLFFLQIQGSGRVILDDGTMVRVGYAAQNGRSYRSIGKVLVDRGQLPLDEVSLQSLKDWLRSHPSEAKSLMDENASYVFFRELSGDGPDGAEGVPLTPGRSLAVDPKFVSYGVPIWLDIESPKKGERIQRLVVAQDTGGAIKGPVRGDLFWGFGPEAEAMAGPMRSRGDYYLFLPR
jgi:membrane-bound lytic murein transglycosylase A